jgi:hypothetical protein
LWYVLLAASLQHVWGCLKHFEHGRLNGVGAGRRHLTGPNYHQYTQTPDQQHKEKPEALLRVGETLWRRAAEGAAVAGMESVLKDGVASVTGPCKAPARVQTPQLQPPPLQLDRMRGSGTNEVGCAKGQSPARCCAHICHQKHREHADLLTCMLSISLLPNYKVMQASSALGS